MPSSKCAVRDMKKYNLSKRMKLADYQLAQE